MTKSGLYGMEGTFVEKEAEGIYKIKKNIGDDLVYTLKQFISKKDNNELELFKPIAVLSMQNFERTGSTSHPFFGSTMIPGDSKAFDIQSLIQQLVCWGVGNPMSGNLQIAGLSDYRLMSAQDDFVFKVDSLNDLEITDNYGKKNLICKVLMYKTSKIMSLKEEEEAVSKFNSIVKDEIIAANNKSNSDFNILAQTNALSGDLADLAGRQYKILVPMINLLPDIDINPDGCYLFTHDLPLNENAISGLFNMTKVYESEVNV